MTRRRFSRRIHHVSLRSAIDRHGAIDIRHSSSAWVNFR
jgi:hypothetical protein